MKYALTGAALGILNAVFESRFTPAEVAAVTREGQRFLGLKPTAHW